jgi:3-amino-4-hydroxybenzoic acid synthase
MGERACLDTCSLLGKDEGLLVGSFASGLVLTVSETHPLPYMPTRPFRVNAGAIHSYTLAPGGRTRYFSELSAGSQLLAARANGELRTVTLGRVKIERRPLLSISATGPDGQRANIIVQDDWHVRLLGPDGLPRNVTELRPGHALLGFLPDDARHVGYPVREFCIEQ